MIIIFINADIKFCAMNALKKMKPGDRCPLCNNICKMTVPTKDATDDKKCKICFEKDAHCIIITPCGHICMCESCLKNWFESKKTCPICWKEDCLYMIIFDFKQKLQDTKTAPKEREKQSEIAEEEFLDHLNTKKIPYDKLLNYLENSDENKEEFEKLIECIDIQQDEKDRDKINEFLLLITSIANNHHRDENFFKKYQILLNYKEQIKKTFSDMIYQF